MGAICSSAEATMIAASSVRIMSLKPASASVLQFYAAGLTLDEPSSHAHVPGRQAGECVFLPPARASGAADGAECPSSPAQHSELQHSIEGSFDAISAIPSNLADFLDLAGNLREAAQCGLGPAPADEQAELAPAPHRAGGARPGRLSLDRVPEESSGVDCAGAVSPPQAAAAPPPAGRPATMAGQVYADTTPSAPASPAAAEDASPLPSTRASPAAAASPQCSPSAAAGPGSGALLAGSPLGSPCPLSRALPQIADSWQRRSSASLQPRPSTSGSSASHPCYDSTPQTPRSDAGSVCSGFSPRSNIMDHLPPPAFAAARFGCRPMGDGDLTPFPACHDPALPDALTTNLYDANRPLSPLTIIELSSSLPPSLYDRKWQPAGRASKGGCALLPSAAASFDTIDEQDGAGSPAADALALSGGGWGAKPKPRGVPPKSRASAAVAAGSDGAAGRRRAHSQVVVEEDVYEDCAQTITAEESSARL